MMTVYEPRSLRRSGPLALTNLEIARGVASTMWQHRDKLAAGARYLWGMLPSSTFGGGSGRKGKSGGRRRLRTTPLYSGSSNFRQTMGATPVAVNLTSSNPVWAEISSAPAAEGEMTGVRICGRQFYCDVTTAAATSTLLVEASGGATLVSTPGNQGRISPDNFNGRLALIARNFAKFAMRHLRFVYEPRVATSQAGSFAMAVNEDPAGDGGFITYSYASIQSIVPSTKAPFRVEVAVEYNYSGQQLFWTETDTNSVASQRLTSQGSFVAFPDISSIGATKQGDLMVEYCCDLYGWQADYGFTVVLRSLEERDWVLTALARHRAAVELEQDDDEADSTEEKSSHRSTVIVRTRG